MADQSGHDSTLQMDRINASPATETTSVVAAPALQGRRSGMESVLVFALCLVFLAVAVAFVAMSRDGNIAAAWLIVIVPFCLSVVGSLVLFHFLASSAQLEHSSYKVGGAIAGFVILFGVLTRAISDPLQRELALYQLTHSVAKDALMAIADADSTIRTLNNSAITAIAAHTLNSTRDTFSSLAKGTYVVTADELPIYLLPMIDNAKSTYYATQFVLPETFWKQSWSVDYFNRNVRAVKDRGVKLTRIFILDAEEAQKQREILNELIKKHVDNGINIRVVDADRYRRDVNPEDLRDLLIVDDEVTGLLLLDKGGGFHRVEFSINPDVIATRKVTYEKLLNHSLSYEQWRTEYYDLWRRQSDSAAR